MLEGILAFALGGVGFVILCSVASNIFWDVKKRRDERDLNNY